ncbi:MAG: S8 family serine peptidase [Bacteroidota bacterium]
MQHYLSKVIASLVVFCFLNAPKMQGQCCPNDSLALLCIYLDFNGPDWNSNINWLTSEPLETWEGVTIGQVGVNDRVIGLELPNNNLVGDTDPAFEDLNALQRLDFSGNSINNLPSLGQFFNLEYVNVSNNNMEDLESFPSIGIDTFIGDGNRFEFDDLELVVPFTTSFTQISPQANVGEERFLFVDPGDGVMISADVGGFNNFYSWYKDGVQITQPDQTPDFGISSFTEFDEGSYVCRVTNSQVQGLTIETEPIKIFRWEFDALGGRYAPNQMIIEFTDDATQFERDTLLDFYDAERLDVCMCGIIELWMLPDTSFLPDGQIIIGVEETAANARSKAKVEETGNNYFLELLSKESAGPKSYATTYQQKTESWGGKSGEPPVKVAEIDVGVDYTHPDLLSGFFWSNDEPVNGVDDDNNCYVDDRRGYDFASRKPDPFDDSESGHGTHVAGIILIGLPTGDIDLINLKSHRADGQGLLFDGTCGIYYARNENADIINLSWGYKGVESKVLGNAIARAGEDCGALVVASAGNLNEDNDQMPHYPSSYDHDNLISVAALNLMEDGLAVFSNFGELSVDLAAPGTRILSTVPGGTFAFKDGTSMAAAAVSRAAAILKKAQPDATYLDIREAILSTVDELGTLSMLETGGKLNLMEAMNYIDTLSNFDTSCLLVSVEEPVFTEGIALKVFPQPFSDYTTLEFELERPGEVEFSIYDSVGRLVYTRYQNVFKGVNRLYWDGKTGAGIDVRPGMYFFNISIDGQEMAGKLMRQ